MASRAQPVLWRETVKAGAVRSGALVTAIALFAVTLMLVLALASYRASDPALNTASGAVPANWLGLPGAWIADIALTLFGPAVALILPVGPIIATRLWRDRPAGRWVRMLRQAVIGVALMACALSFVSDSAVLALPAGWGGVIGLSVAGLVDWALAFSGQPAVVTWGAAVAGLAFGLGGAYLWGRSLELDLAERGLARLRRRRATSGEDADGVPWDDDDSALYDDDGEEDEEPLTLTRKA
ncbi:DNA translocase FtsK 4TM domain-containing protein, partial [Sphingomonas sp.]|uniref:DNA translocase FtsK 4TM domain-containing protein n=1 Tax=Sphingomonas sp. TaxID=28214 RepID=UPI00289687FC